MYTYIQGQLSHVHSSAYVHIRTPVKLTYLGAGSYKGLFSYFSFFFLKINK